MSDGDYDRWVKLFAADGTIDDPSYGEAANSPTAGQGYFSDYFKALQSNHSDWTAPPQDLFINPNNPDVVAIHWLHSFKDQKGGATVTAHTPFRGVSEKRSRLCCS